MVKFREQLMNEYSAKTSREVVRKLIPPKGVKRKGSDEGTEILDCEEEEIPTEKFVQECDNENTDDAEESENMPSENQARSTSTKSKNALSLTSFSNDPEIEKDLEFLEKFQQIIENSDTSKLFIPYMSQFHETFWKS